MIGVLAGSYHHYMDWLHREADPPYDRYYYIRDEESIRGLRFEGIIWIESAHLNRAYNHRFRDYLISSWSMYQEENPVRTREEAEAWIKQCRLELETESEYLDLAHTRYEAMLDLINFIYGKAE